jgi:hypothetical protein
MIIELISNRDLICDDHWINISKFLTPKDFYNLRATCEEYSKMDHYIYWVNHPHSLTFSRCIRASCPSLLTYMLMTQNVNDQLLVRSIIPKCITYDMHNSIFDYVIQKKSHELTSQTICKYIELKNYIHFHKYILVSYNNTNIWWEQIFDLSYDNQNWMILAILFTYKTRYFITWVFGNFKTVVDTEVISNMKHIYMHLSPCKKEYFINILKKYYEWLWVYKSDRLDSLEVIIKMDDLNLFLPMLSEKIQIAMNSPHKEFLEYIIIKDRPKLDLAQTKNITYDKAKLIYKDYILEKYNNIILLLIALIICAGYSSFLRSSPSESEPEHSSSLSSGARLNKIEV